MVTGTINWGKEILKNTDECVNVIEEIIFDMRIDTEIYSEDD